MITSIGFSGGIAPAQLVIQGVTFSKDAHCFAIVDSGPHIIDATFQHGVKERTIDEVSCVWMDVLPLHFLTIKQKHDLHVWIAGKIGCRYDYGFTMGYPWAKRDWLHGKDKWACSELIGAGLIHVGAFPELKIHRLTPRNLRRRIEELRNNR